MMNYLALNIGNTSTKMAVFENDVLVKKKVLNNKEQEKICEEILEMQVERAIVSATSKISEELQQVLNQIEQVVDVSNQLKLPITISYKTPDTLGDDRIASVIGARLKQPKGSLLVITAGTCITYNILTEKNEFLGGAISPGIHMRYLAMHTFTSALPLAPHKEYNQLIGHSTLESLQSGVQNGVLAEVDGIITQYKLQFPEITVFITGGDANFFESRTKNRIFANLHLEEIGMNEILKFNLLAE